MTIGERISQKRKELGLSQESLGEKLGISRQAIYKWESDSALPEIDKLVALSRLYGVSVGWLLGVEDTPAKADSGELTEKELQTVEEIVSRYLEATREHKDERAEQFRVWEDERARFKKAVFSIFLTVFCVGLAVAVGFLWKKVETQGDETIQYISDWSSAIDRQIREMNENMETTIRQQSSQLSDYTCEVVGADLNENTVTLAFTATPKTWTEGLTARFVVTDAGGDYYESEPAEYENGGFAGEVTAELTDHLTFSVVLIQANGTQTTQVMETCDGLYTASLPYCDFSMRNWYQEGKTTDELTGEVINVFSMYIIEVSNGTKVYQGVSLSPDRSDLANLYVTENVTVEEFQLGLFQNGELVEWAEDISNEYSDRMRFQFSELELPMEEGDFVHVVGFIRDNYGRVTAQAISLTRDVKCEAPYPSGWDREMTPLDLWTYPHDADGFPKV